MPSDTPAIEVQDLSKIYRIYDRPADRLKQLLWPGQKTWGREFRAVEALSFTLPRGMVLGLVGRNGAGKSTLLQLICGTATPTSGNVAVHGRVAALLELGAGFNPEFTGRENVYLNGAVLGLSKEELDARYAEIVDFSGIKDFIDQPVKTYSSGMYVRLAFSIATHVDPDILVIDEALSVGDGEFGRKSFERIMLLKERGATVIFCSHSLFQIEALCHRAIWLDKGRVVADGDPARVVASYQAYLDSLEKNTSGSVDPVIASTPKGYARLTRVETVAETPLGGTVKIKSGADDFWLTCRFASDPAVAAPTVAVTLHLTDGRTVASAGAWNDGVMLERSADGFGFATLKFPRISLLKGHYFASVHLLCDRGLYTYDTADRVFQLEVTQDGLEQGIVHLPHGWETGSDQPIRTTEVESKIETSQPNDLLSALGRASEPMKVGDSIPSIRFESFLRDPNFSSMAARFGLEPADASNSQLLKSREPTWQIGWVTRSNTEAWAKLFNLCFGYVASAEWIQWKYAHASNIGIGAWKGNELIAFYGGMPRPIRLMGRSATAVQVGDVMVSPKERGTLSKKGPFQLVASSYLETSIGTDKPYLLGFGFPSGKAMALAKRLGMYEEVDRVAEMSWPSEGVHMAWQLRTREVSSTDADTVNALWNTMAAKMTQSIVGERGWDHLAQRYLNHPSVKYFVLMVRYRISAKPVGVLVLRDHGDHGMELLDVIGDPANFSRLTKVARRFAHRLGRHRVLAWITQSHAGLLRDSISKETSTDVYIPTNVWTAGPSVGDIKDRWFLMGGDADFR